MLTTECVGHAVSAAAHAVLFLTLPGSHSYSCSYHAKELAASNQTQKRLQEAELQHMQQELQLLEQQLELEGAVRAASVSFLAAKAGSLQEATVSWHSRREDDAQSKERELEVCNSGAETANARDHRSLSWEWLQMLAA